MYSGSFQHLMKDIGEAPMKRSVILTVIKIFGEAFLLTIIVVIIVGITGNWRKWDTPLQYSNALFLAGLLVIVAGASSRMGAGQEWGIFQRLRTESFRDMSTSEQANYIVDVSSSFRLVILGVVSGVSLILISLLVPNLF